MSNKKNNESVMARPKGMPKTQWAAMNAKQKKTAAKKWHFSLQDFSMGSGDAPTKKRGMRSVISLNPRSQENAPNGTTMAGQRISQDELLRTVDGGLGFQCISLQVQPGLATVFPWLSKMAALYQKYRIHNLRFYLKTLVSGFSTLGQTGRAILSFDSDSAATILQNLNQAEAMEPHADGLPSDNIALVAPCNRVGPLWTRVGPVPSGTDIKLYDFGTLFLCTTGFSAAGTFAELRASYDVEFMLPQLPNDVKPVVNFTASTFKTPINASLATGVALPLQLSQVGQAGNGLALDIPVSGTVFTMPAGLFEVSCKATFTPSAFSRSTTYLWVWINGVQVTEYDVIANGTSMATETLSADFVYAFNAGDTLEFRAMTQFASGTCTVVGTMYATLA